MFEPLRPWISSILLSKTTERLRLATAARLHRWQERRPQLLVSVSLTDPASLLLLRELRRVQQAYDVEIDLRWLEPAPGPEGRVRGAAARHIADRLGDSFNPAPAEHLAKGLSAQLAAGPAPASLDDIIDGMTAYWSGDEQAVGAIVEEFAAITLERARVRYAEDLEVCQAAGLFEPAAVRFIGDRYIGIERLHYLQARLDTLELRKDTAIATELSARLTRLRPTLDAMATHPDSLELYFSFRSPYSYLALAKLVPYCEESGVRLTVTPVLPMVRRGVPLPAAKRSYILRDASREARRQCIAFGRLKDPLQAAEALISGLLSVPAESRPRLALAFTRAACAEGRSLLEVEERREVARLADISLAPPGSADTNAARLVAEENASRLGLMGHWGVPVLVDGDRNIWGQDKFGLLLASGDSAASQEVS